ncbi:hypothetical protein MMC24_002543 [Lignoscripta atroalba]|nr:hypothetical protein [Lignoscripta atroalba]
MRKCFTLTRSLSLQPSLGHQILIARPGRALRSTKAKPPVPSNADILSLLEGLQDDLSSDSDGETNDFSHSESRDGAEQSTSMLEQLPLSPLMHPNLIKARKVYHEAKPLPSKDQSEFQTLLQKNPYGTSRTTLHAAQMLIDVLAHALATPIRACNLTGSRLPSFFHLAFGIRKNPRTGRPWHLPYNLDPTEPKAVSKVVDVDQAVEEVEDLKQKDVAKEDYKEEGTDLEGNRELTSPRTQILPSRVGQLASKFRSPTISSSHIISQSQALKFISGLKPRDYQKLIPTRWREIPSLNIKDIVWREDMDTFVLKLLRMKVSGLLGYLGNLPAAYISSQKNYENIGKRMQVGAVLWLGAPVESAKSDISSNSQNVVLDETANSGVSKLHPKKPLPAPVVPNLKPAGPGNGNGNGNDSKDGPPPYAMYHYKNTYIPIYNLQTLLGEDHVRELRACSTRFGDEIAVVKNKKNTVPTQMWLWKLMGYVASGTRN